jgi:hypothetical protein
MTVLLLIVAGFFALQTPASSQPLEAGLSLDYEFFKTRVQPIFLNKRPGNARCYVCHRGTGSMTYLHVLMPGAATCVETQPLMHLDVVRRFVVPGNPLKSKLLMHPLAEEAGGDDFHGGGHHWKSQDDPEWQTMAAWVRGQKQ